MEEIGSNKELLALAKEHGYGGGYGAELTEYFKNRMELLEKLVVMAACVTSQPTGELKGGILSIDRAIIPTAQQVHVEAGYSRFRDLIVSTLVLPAAKPVSAPAILRGGK